MRRDEFFQCVRWFNLVVGFYNLHYYVNYGNWALLALGGSEHRGMGIHEKGTEEGSIGDAYFFLLYVFVSEIGKKLDKGYRCPLYCDIDHKHIYAKKKSHIQGTDRIPGSGESDNREQSESDIRPIASI